MIKYKHLPFLTIILFVLLFPIISIAQEFKPDLIISSVTSRTYISEKKHKPGEPVRSGGNREMVEYTITIKNIGNKDFSEPLYLSQQRSPFTEEEHYSRTKLINGEHNLIPTGGSIDVKIVDVVSTQNPGNTARFLINTEGKTRQNSVLPKIEELNYDNNIFMY